MPGFQLKFRVQAPNTNIASNRHALNFRDRNDNTKKGVWKIFVEAALAVYTFIIFIDYRSPYNNINRAILWNSLIKMIYS
jgi:hypothetical protein